MAMMTMAMLMLLSHISAVSLPLVFAAATSWLGGNSGR